MAHHQKHFREAGQYYEQAFALPAARPSASDFYDAACSWALANELAPAFRDLDRATQAGWDDVTHLKTDSDLTTLHAEKRWQPMLRKLERFSS